MDDKVRMFLAIAIVSVYCVLVLNNQASVEGFVMLATYIVKKYLDSNKTNGGA